MPICLIYAQAANAVIGKDGTMPWHLPEDLAHFRQQTQGAAVVMGRATWDSLPARFRPLPGRTNIVVTRNPAWQAEGAIVAHSLPEALAEGARHSATVWVIGGAQVYAQALPLADAVTVTHIHQDFDGDAFAPTLGPQWQAVQRHDTTSAQGLPLSFVRYERQNKPETRENP
ncbi:MAG: dihydrofolate reductase [Comamonas sp.]|nr:dihydrofolate reductase [Comamonas sp.]